jgi:hypothetical protein
VIEELPAEHGNRWSWGRYFVWLAESGKWPVSSIAEHIDMVREECLKSRVTWNDKWKPNPTGAERQELKNKLTDIAWKLELPYEVKKHTEEQIQKLGDLAAPVADLALGIPIATVGLKVGELVLRKVPTGSLTQIPILRRVIEWPGLLEKPVTR